MNTRALAVLLLMFALSTSALVVLAYEPTDPSLYVSLAIVVLGVGVIGWKLWALRG